jgi:hypothetical protein
MKELIFCLYALIASAAAHATNPESSPFQLQDPQNVMRPFTNDRCSYFFDGNWGECCISHDFAYWKGGTGKERKIADQEFRSCLKEKTNDALAQMMYLGVRIFGGLRNTTHTWGYGWLRNRGNRALSSSENEMISKWVTPELLSDLSKSARRRGFKNLPYPTFTGNYCIDQTLPLLSEKGTVTNVRTTKFVHPNIWKIETPLCKGYYVARFNITSISECTLPHYRDTAPEFLMDIKAYGDCR